MRTGGDIILLGIRKPKNYPIFLDTEVMDYGLLAAISLFYMLPAMIFFLIAQRALARVTIAGVRA